jgi:putative thiamine transport system substrate-binding protein
MKLSLLGLLGLTLATPALADWQQTLEAARGQTVYWNAWGGDARTNAFIDWVGQQTEAQFGVKVEQVKLTDTAEAVTRVISEKAAGQDSGGSVDLIWINGPNFLAMKEQGLLHGPFVAGLPRRSRGWKARGGWRSLSSPMTPPASMPCPQTWPVSSHGRPLTRAG